MLRARLAVECRRLQLAARRRRLRQHPTGSPVRPRVPPSLAELHSARDRSVLAFVQPCARLGWRVDQVNRSAMRGFHSTLRIKPRDSGQVGMRLAAASAGNDSPERSPYLRRTICATPPTAPPSVFNAARHPGRSRHARGSSTSLLLGARHIVTMVTYRYLNRARTRSRLNRHRTPASSRTTPHPLAQAAKRRGQDCGPGDQ